MKDYSDNYYLRNVITTEPSAYKNNLALFKKIKQVEKNEKDEKKREVKIKEIKDKIIIANLNLVANTAKERIHYCSHLLFTDLIQEGILGLFRAVDKFDYRRGFLFSTYARWWIAWSIKRAIDNTEKTIRIPVSAQERINKLVKIQPLLKDINEEEAEEMINNLCKLSKNQVKTLKEAATKEPISLFKPLEISRRNGGKDIKIIDTLEDGDFKAPEEIIFEKDLREKISVILTNVLTPREEEVIRRCFGIGILNEETLHSIGESKKLSRERIRQIKEEALKKLRNSVCVKSLNFN